MKKINVILMSLLTIVLSGFLVACTLKDAKASFSQSEVVVSLGDSINLEDYLKTEGVETNEISLKFSNPSLFSINGKQIVAKASGRSYVYATYKSNSLSSMQIVVRKKFDAPSEFSLSESGLLSWNVVSSYFENEKTPTKASSYKIEGTCKIYDSSNPETVKETKIINKTEQTNSFQLTDKGVYQLTITAQTTGYFDSSNSSEKQTLYFGYMDSLTKDDLSWNAETGTLSWSNIAGAKYKVSLDGIQLDSFQTTTSKDLTTYFSNASAGTHDVFVYVYDSEGKKLAQKSESLSITKLDAPVVNYEHSNSTGGQIAINVADNAQQYVLKTKKGEEEKTFTFDVAGEKLTTDLSGLDTGLYDVKVQALNDEGLFFRSNEIEFGKIYKLPILTFDGRGENLENGNLFNAKVVSEESLIQTNFAVFSLKSVSGGFDINEEEKEFELQINEAGVYALDIVNIPRNQQNTVSGNEVFVLNSNKSEKFTITKLADFETNYGDEIVHKYQSGVSELKFSKIENATRYAVQYNNGTTFENVDSAIYQITVEDEFVSVKFNGKIEKLFTPTEKDDEYVYNFKIIAKTEDEKFAINSSAEKVLKLLSAPTSVDSGNSTNKTYSWNSVENSAEYRLEIYEIDKDIYLDNKESINLDTTTLVKQETTVKTTSYEFENVGYFYVKTYAISDDENKFISSIDCLQEVFYIAEQLKNGEVKLGYNQEYKNYSGFTSSSGYFVQVENGENVDSYELSLDNSDSSLFKIMKGNTSIYLLSEDFSVVEKEFVVSVVGHANDETLYLESLPTQILIERLKTVEYADLTIDDLTSIITIKEKTGVTGGKIWLNDKNSAVTTNGIYPRFDISDLSNFALQFSLYGTEIEENIYQNANEKVYLDSLTSTIKFERLQAPSNLKYYDGSLTFEHTAVAGKKYYVLDLICALADGETMKLSVKFDNILTAVYEGNDIPLLVLSKNYISYSGNLITIDIQGITNLIKLNSQIAEIYNQALSIDFSVYAYQNSADSERVILSSPYATIFGDATKTNLLVEKMQQPTLNFEKKVADFVFSWSEPETAVAVSSETSYQIYLNGEAYGEKLSATTSFTVAQSKFAEPETYYSFSLKAKNPYYLDDSTSNIVKIYQLKSLSKITLGQDGKLTYELPTLEKDFCKYVEVTRPSTSVEQNTTGVVEITEDGEYGFRIVGKKIENGAENIYYIDSEIATWTMTKMETLKPADVEIGYLNNLFTWNSFGENKNLSNLCYITIFKDENGGVVICKTATNSLDLLEVKDEVSKLYAGQIEVAVSACLESYSVVAGGTIYYAHSQELLNGKKEANHYIYTNSEVKKLTTPNVVDVQFVSDELSEAQFPNIVITFEGNYGAFGKFSIFVNDGAEPLKTITIVQSGSKYSFTLTKEDYNNNVDAGQIMKISILALSDDDIPSSEGSVEILRNVNLESVEFENDAGNYNHNLTIEFDSAYLEYTAGGVVLKIEYMQTGEEEKTEYIKEEVSTISETLVVDMSKFIKEKLANGGVIKVSAYVNNYADNDSKLYCLATPVMKQSITYNVLKQVETITKQTGGFVIDSSLNNASTIYIVGYGASTFEVEKIDNKFYFEFPNTWANGSYDLTIYATENGYINSVINTIKFELNRIDRVASVEMKRATDDLSSITLSWESINNASGYILNLYDQNDLKKNNLLYSFNTQEYHASLGTTMGAVNGRIGYNLTEILGIGYQNLLDYGKISAFDLLSDLNLTFDLITIGNENYNNSYAYSFNGTIKGNPVEMEDIVVDEYGTITFASEVGETYIYRFVSAEGVELQSWQTVEATMESTKLSLDTSKIETSTLFNVEIIVLGTATEQGLASTEYEFEIDSSSITSLGKDLTFTVNDEIAEIGYSESLTSSLAFAMYPNTFTNLYVGLSKDSIFKEEVVQFVPTDAHASQIANCYVYEYSFANLLNELRENGYEINVSATDIKLYFWSYRLTTNVASSYTISKVYEFSFKFVNENNFVEVLKIGDLGEESKFTEDYANTFVTFKNDDVVGSQETMGIYIRITQLSTGDEIQTLEIDDIERYSTIKFLTKEQLTSHEYFEGQNLFVINLTALFEDEDLLSKNGTFKVEFSRLQVKTTIISEDETIHDFILTDWLEGDGNKEFEFERLPSLESVLLSAGNLYWSVNGEKASKYYVYFISGYEGEISENNYVYYSTDKTSFDASDFASADNLYYICVQSINEDPYSISSAKAYVNEVVDGEIQRAEVYKNQMTTPLELKDGRLHIDWNVNGDFYKLLTSTEKTYANIARELAETVFMDPFTFTLEQLLDDNITIRLRFTQISSGAEGIRKVFDINAKYLLSDFYEFGLNNGFDVKARLNDLYTNAESAKIKDLIDRFIKNIVENGSDGIANSNILFDDYFETIQLGKYKLEYCLLGNNKTLNSTWYNFNNKNGESLIYANGEPSVRAIKKTDESDDSINTYRLLIKKSEIYDYVSGSYKLVTADNYVVKMTDGTNTYVFAIVKGISKYSLSLLDSEIDDTVSVYEADYDGQIVSNGNYLMFYFNYNNGDSILGKYGDEISKLTYSMQVYAKGNDYSASSKSDYYKVTFLGFGESLTVNNGEFVWTNTQGARKTKVIYKKDTSSEPANTLVDGSLRTSRFSLDGLGYGLYNYIKFVVPGEVSNNSIYVDSEIYQIDNVYKLAPPTLKNDYGYIAIDDSQNKSMLEKMDASGDYESACYSDGNLYNYRVYNKEASSYINFSDTNNANDILYYETGITGIELSNPDFDYKNTEEQASVFNVASLGTTASVNIERNEDLYYLRKIYCKDINNENNSTTLSVAIKSQYSSINATMLDSVSNLHIENGVLKWFETNGKELDGETLTIPENSQIIYKVTVVQYVVSNIEEGTTETNVGEEYYYYTAETSFDFALIDESQINQNVDKPTYLKATVQALALEVSEVETLGSKKLVEGGFASGNVLYADTDVYVLMSNGVILKEIDRLAPVEDSIEVVDGKLYWKYRAENSIESESKFFEKYSFEVVDEDGNVVDGTFEVSAIEYVEEDDNYLFTIKFVENVGAIKCGNQILKIYATQGSKNGQLVIKSFAREKEINKLETIKSKDFTIVSEVETETLDMSSYFADGNDNTIVVNIEILRKGKTDEYSFEFNKNINKLYILNKEPNSEDTINLPQGYQGYIVVADEEIVKIKYLVKNEQSGTIYSDISEEFVLQRSGWGDEGKVIWNSDSQTFSWQYDGYYSTSKVVTAKTVETINALVDDTVLYNDSALEEESGITLLKDEEINVEEVLENGNVKILYLGENYYISQQSYEEREIFGTELKLEVGKLFKIISKTEDETKIELEDGTQYLIKSSDVVEPVYIVEVIYSFDEYDTSTTTRIYTTTKNEFTPTIIAKRVRINVRVKLGDSNIQSGEISYLGEDAVYNLFESGEGTETNPYEIVNETQFKNIKHRMTKESYVVSYSQKNPTEIINITESTQYYFKITNDLILSELDDETTYIDGILFKGSFDGVIDGEEYTISYISNGVSELTQAIRVEDGNVLSSGQEKYTDYSYGTALFETLSSSSTIKYLKLNVKYKTASDVYIQEDSLISGLAISNNGIISNVDLIGFESNFIGYRLRNERIMMVYSGIASINTGGVAKIQNCDVETSIKITGSSSCSQLIFASGITYTNYAVIESCVTGKGDVENYTLQVTCQTATDTVQVAGVSITNTSSATLKKCENYFDITVEAVSENNNITAYLAGITDKGLGTLTENNNNGTLTIKNISSVYQGEISAVTK